MISQIYLVVPAKAGTQGGKLRRPASLGPRFRGGDGVGETP
jgi:hypothetical protein